MGTAVLHPRDCLEPSQSSTHSHQPCRYAGALARLVSTPPVPAMETACWSRSCKFTGGSHHTSPGLLPLPADRVPERSAHPHLSRPSFKTVSSRVTACHVEGSLFSTCEGFRQPASKEKHSVTVPLQGGWLLERLRKGKGQFAPEKQKLKHSARRGGKQCSQHIRSQVSLEQTSTSRRLGGSKPHACHSVSHEIKEKMKDGDLQKRCCRLGEVNGVVSHAALQESCSSMNADAKDVGVDEWVSRWWLRMVDERWAGPSFFNSPPPSSLPVPTFTSMKRPSKAAPSPSPSAGRDGSPNTSVASVVSSGPGWRTPLMKASSMCDAQFATKDLRRLLHLDHHPPSCI